MMRPAALLYVLVGLSAAQGGAAEPTSRPATRPNPPAGTLPPAEAARVRDLVRTLGDEDPDVVVTAVDSLRDVGRQAVPYVIEGLRDPADRVRAGSARALGVLDDGRAVEPLVSALADGAPGVRVQAALALGNLGRLDAVPALVKALTDQPPAVRANAALSLGQTVRLARARRALSPQEAEQARRAVQPLIGALSDREAAVRGHAAMSLGVLGDPLALAPLILATTDPEPLCRASACHGLGDLGDRAAGGVLVDLLDDADPTVRRSAIEALEQITGNTLGYLPHAPAAERQAAVARWRTWWARTRSALQTRP